MAEFDKQKVKDGYVALIRRYIDRALRGADGAGAKALEKVQARVANEL